MRHVWSLLVGIVVAPLAWLVMCVGQVGSATGFTAYSRTGEFAAGDFVRPFLLLVAAGLILGTLACLRVSPAGPALVGIAYLAAYAGLLIWPHRTYDLFAYTFHVGVLGDAGHGDLTTPLTSGTAALVGALLLVALASVKRWRRWPRPLAATPVEVDEPTGYQPVAAPVPTSPAPVLPQQSSVPVEDDNVGTLVWTRDADESPTKHTPAAGTDTGSLRNSGPWDSPPSGTGSTSATR